MDPILVSGRCKLKIICTRKFFMNPCWGEVGYHDHGTVEAQEPTSLRADPVDAIQKRGFQHHQEEDNVRSVEDAVEYVRKTIGYEQGVSVVDHINEFNMFVSQLSFVEINFEDKIKALILMSSLLESWDTVVAAISTSRGSDKLKFDEIRDVVLSESIRKREIESSSGSALSVDQRRRSKPKGPNK